MFPEVKALAKPLKGSANLFYNLLQSSKINANAKHGSCPLVQGHKWGKIFYENMTCDVVQGLLLIELQLGPTG